MYDITVFCSRLKEARINAGLTQKQLGDELGMAQNTYGRFERGKFQLNYEQLVLVAKRLDVSLDYLLGINDEL